MPLVIMFSSDRGAVVEGYEKGGSKVKLDRERNFSRFFGNHLSFSQISRLGMAAGLGCY